MHSAEPSRAESSLRTTQGVSLLDLMTLLDTDFDHNTRHGSADRPRVRSRLFARDSLHCRIVVLDGDSTNLRGVNNGPILARSLDLPRR